MKPYGRQRTDVTVVDEGRDDVIHLVLFLIPHRSNKSTGTYLKISRKELNVFFKAAVDSRLV